MLNDMIIQGHVVFDVVEKKSPKGQSYSRNVLAVKRNFKNQKGEYETDFIPFVCYGSIKDIFINNVSKGERILVKGSLYTNIRTLQVLDEDGIVHPKKEKSFVLRANQIIFNGNSNDLKTNDKKKKKTKEYYEAKAKEYQNMDSELFHDDLNE